MYKKSLLGLILFACLIISGLFAGANYLTSRGSQVGADIEFNTQEETGEDSGIGTSVNDSEDKIQAEGEVSDLTAEDPWLSTDRTDMGAGITKDETTNITLVPTKMPVQEADIQDADTQDDTQEADTQDDTKEADTQEASEISLATSLNTLDLPELIIDCTAIDYQAYIPEMIFDSALEAALDINNPVIAIDAEAAILFDAATMEVLYHKNSVQAMFPASTAKLLTALVALKWCEVTEEVTIGDEVSMIASDSTRAYLVEGQILTIRNLLEGMLLPSGNDAAYAVAVYVGRKSLDNNKASVEAALLEFMRLMNEEAVRLGVKNSCFKTPDGYDAVGQYTTAYDMGLIGIAAANNPTIVEITQKSSGRNIFASGEDITWSSTNKLITRYSGQYYSKAIGLKTGTSSMAGRCIVAAAESDGRKVVCVILDSSSAGRWEDAIALLKYGLN